MNLKNNFNESDRAVYAFQKECMVCSSNQGLELHHILHRDGRHSGSILNSVMLCKKCHENYTLLDKGWLLQNTIKFLLREDYQFKKRDALFYEENKKYYNAP